MPLLGSALAYLALYCGAEVTAVWTESAGLQPYASQVADLKPTWTWGLTLFALHGWSPFAARVFAFVHLLGTAATSARGSVPPTVRRYITYPTVGAITAVVASSLMHHSSPVSGPLALLAVLLHACSCVHEVIWRMVLPAPLIADFANLPQLRERHRLRPNVELFDLPSSGSPGVTLSGAIVRCEQQFGRPPRVLLYLGGNGELWEHSVWSVGSLAKKVGATAVLFNYRGVGNSGGVTRRAAGMAVDASDVIKFLLRTTPGLLESDILIFGHSIGGGVAAAVVATKHRECSVVFDRTFSSMPDAAKGLFSKLPMGLIRPVVAASFGTMDTASLWPLIEHERKLVTFHRADRVINFALSSLARGEAFQHGPSARYVVELRGDGADPHNSDMTDFEGSTEATRRMAAFFRP